MPQLIPLVLGAAATWAAGAGAAGGIAASIATGIGLGAAYASVVAGVIGTVVATVASMAMSSIMSPKAASTPSPSAETQQRRQSIRGGIEPRQVVYGWARVGGVIVYAASSGSDQSVLHLVVVLAGHPCHAVETIILNEQSIDVATQMSGSAVTGGAFAGLADIRIYLGGQASADGTLIAESPDGWSADHKLLGCTYLALRLVNDQDKFPSGLQNVSAIVRGKNDVFDPRTSTSGYTANWALCVLDYLRGDHGLACSPDEIDMASMIVAANLADELVQINEAGTEFQVRYGIDGAFSLDAAPLDVMEGLLAAGAGTLVYVQGQYQLYGGAYSAPTVTLTPGDFAGDVELETRPPRRQLFNAVRGTYIDPGSAWQAREFPPFKVPEFEAQDGEQIWSDLALRFTIDGTRAQRLAKIALFTARDSLRVTAPMRYAAIRLAVWQMVGLTFPDFGWSAKPFRVESWRYEPATGQLWVTFREENAANYAWWWDAGAFIPPVPDTTLVNPLVIPAISGLTVTPGTVLQPDGGILPVLDVGWIASPHPFVTGHEVQWRVPFGDWVGQEVRMPTTRLTVRSVLAGQDYEVRVRPIAGLVRGPWVTSSLATGAPDTTPPGVPTGLAAQGVVNGIALRWTNPTASDFDRIEIEESATGGGSGFAQVGVSKSTFFVRDNLPAGATAWYRIRALDRSGNASGYTGEVSATASHVVTGDIASGALSTISGGETYSGLISIDFTDAVFPGTSFVQATLASVSVTVPAGEEGRAIVAFDGNRNSAGSVLFSAFSETGGGGDGGSSGGGGE